jgi:hypothetical protein
MKNFMESNEIDHELYTTINGYLSAADADWDYYCSVNY